MENTPNDILLRPSENAEGVAPELTLDTPHFDEQAIQSARPAVPLVRKSRRGFWPLALLLMCGSSLLGGALALTLSRYENRSGQISNPSTSVAPEPSRVSTESGTDRIVKSESGPLLPSVPEERANDAAPKTSEENAEALRAARPREDSTAEQLSDNQSGETRAALHGAFKDWIAATNARDITRQMNFYNQKVNAFYLTRNVPREAVRAEKSRVFGRADVIDIKAGAPGIRLSGDGRTATMRFRKKYAIEGGGEDRRGEVVQELRWRRTDDGWKIVSERDLRVIN